MKRILLGLLALVVILGGLGYAFRVPITLSMMERVLATNMTQTLQDVFPEDGLHVYICGAGSPMPDPARGAPCTAIVAGDLLFVVDSGSGASPSLATAGIGPGNITGVFYTHLHSDHIDGLGELMLQHWATKPASDPNPMAVYGPTGVEQVVAGFNMAYGPDKQYRVDHHGPETMNPLAHGAAANSFAEPAEGELVTIFEQNGVKISAFKVDHPPIVPAVGYRIDYKGRSVVISGDTNKSGNIAMAARDADLLLHEALSRELVAIMTSAAGAAGNMKMKKITEDILDYHASPVEAAQTAQEAGVQMLVYHHVVPPLILAPMADVFLEGTNDAFDGKIVLGEDGLTFSMPAGSDEIIER